MVASAYFSILISIRTFVFMSILCFCFITSSVTVVHGNEASISILEEEISTRSRARARSTYFKHTLLQNIDTDTASAGVRSRSKSRESRSISRPTADRHAGPTRRIGSRTSHGGRGQLQFISLRGRYMSSGSSQQVDGRVHLLPSDDCGHADTKGFARLPQDWVAVVHYSAETEFKSRDGGSGDCPLVMDRVRNALMFGASAIIILSLNPGIIRELDVAQMVSKPVVYIDSAENITKLLTLIFTQVKLRAQIGASIIGESTMKVPTFAMWSTCGKAPGGRGVICVAPKHQGDTSKADPSMFWQCFYAGVLFLVLLTGVKSRMEDGGWRLGDHEMELSMRKMAHQALAMMKTMRYKKKGEVTLTDTCAICLEEFLHKQKLRILPCSHPYHTKCVDRWLVRNRTCPLCKLNIIEQFEGS